MFRSVIVVITGSLCLPLLAAGQQPADPTKTGLKEGGTAPAIKLMDQTGTERALEELRQDADYLALVFYRSADW